MNLRNVEPRGLSESALEEVCVGQKAVDKGSSTGVKLTEALFHLRPRALWRLITLPDRRVRKIMRRSLAVGVRVVTAEIAEFIFATRFARQGQLERLPGQPAPEVA